MGEFEKAPQSEMSFILEESVLDCDAQEHNEVQIDINKSI